MNTPLPCEPIRLGYPLFIVFEGIDGAGKSTQAELLREYLENSGVPVLLTAEPTNGPLGQRIRSLHKRLQPDEEEELFRKDRMYHLNSIILPALSLGKTVICDRYFYSSIAYQGARGLNPEVIRRRNSFAQVPHLVFLFVLPVKDALLRIIRNRKSELDVFESEKSLEKTAEIFEAMDYPEIVRIDARFDVLDLHQEIITKIRQLISQTTS